MATIAFRDARRARLLRGRVVAAWQNLLTWSGCLTSARKTTPAAAPRQLRRIVVPASLDELQGPGEGVVELPVRLYWSAGSNRFDLSDPDQVSAMYDAVLDAASTIDDITAYLNAGLLASTWPALSVGPAKRKAWQDQFVVLRPRRPAVAA